MGISAPL